jgi:hypothetical protein
MNGIESQDGTIDSSALWQLLQELEAGTLGPEKRDELMALVERSPSVQRAYLEYFEMAAMLEAEAATHSEQGKLPVVGQARLPLRIFRRSVMAAAAVLVLGAIIAALVMVKPPEAGYLTAAATADTKWTVDGLAQDPGAAEWTVSAGSTVQVWSGTVKLRLESGAAMVMQGPAAASFPELDRPVLSNGWLWIDSGESGGSFEVNTPELLVRDIGTRFGVRVPEQGPAEVHLIEGKVEVFARSTQEKITTLEPEKRGVAIAATGKPAGLALARDPFPGLADLLAAPGNYPTTVRSQNPAGYWRMQEEAPGFLSNEVPGGLIGRCHPKVLTGEPGPGPASNFHGFGKDNPAALLTGARDRASLSLGTTPVHQGVLLRDDFSGDGGDLDGATPEVTTDGAKWVAAPVFNRDGSIDPEAGSATVAFRPVDGVAYSLDASVVAEAGPSDDWIALGFARGQSSEASRGARFTDNAVVGRAWMLHRAADSTHPVNRAWLSTDGADWVWPGPSPLGGRVDLRIVLDTTGGPGTWTATWFAKRPADDRYTTVRETAPLVNESITSVGLTVSGPGISGSIESLSLRADRKASAPPGTHLADGPARVARKEGAVSLWIRPEPGGKRKEILWAAGEHKGSEAIHAHLTADGRAGFFMENGRYDVLIASEESINDGKWHHLAASWHSSAVDLYLDGKLVAQDTEYRAMQQGFLPELQFGAGTASYPAPFIGWIDEIALWDRALTAAEVRHQFQSARGR